MKEITLEERKKIQLGMLVEIDEFCRKHNIKYMLAFGTLLGAVRHKGFIPWDDDVDICMPVEDMLRFKKEFKSEKLKYNDIDTDKDYCYPFSHISHVDTYQKDMCFITYGVSIDVYPLIEVPSSQEVISELFNIGVPLLNKRYTYMKWNSRWRRYLPFKFNLPGYRNSIKKYRDFLFNILSKKGGHRYFFVTGPLKNFECHTFDFNPFEEMIELEFEGKKVMSPAKYHDLLSKIYGDYMQLPPEDQRHPYHGGKFFWK